MKGLTALFLGIFGTFAFSWVGLTVIPNWQIGHLNPQSDEEGTDIYPMPQSGMVTRGARVYAANGCNYCHSEQVRAEYAGADIERKWGDRRSAPRDYIFERPVFLGKMRMGQDLANIGARAPKEEESPSPGGSAAGSPGAAVQSPSPSTEQPKVKGAESPGASPAAQAAISAAATSPPVSPNSPPSKSPAVAGPRTGIASPSPGAAPAAAASPAHRLERDHHGPSRQRACRQCIQPHGIMCIFIRRAVSILIRTCRPIVFSTKLVGSVTRVHQTLYNLPVPTPRPRDGKLFPLTTRNVLWRTCWRLINRIH